MLAAVENGRRFIGGDLYSRETNPERGLDAAPWVEIAARVADERFTQARGFK